MKRNAYITVLVVLLHCLTAARAAEIPTVLVTIPEFPIIVNDEVLDYQNTSYPFILYKDITYFPMTYGHCNLLGIATSWTEEDGLYVAYKGDRSYQQPDYGTADNSAAYYTANIAQISIHVNGKRIDNQAEEYPLLQFRDITYFPITWRFANEEFSWKIGWDEGLRINTVTTTPWLFGTTKDNGIELQKNEFIYESSYVGDQEVGIYFDRTERSYARLDFSDETVSACSSPTEEKKYSDRSYLGEAKVEIEGNQLVYEGTPIADVSEIIALDAVSDYGISAGYPISTYGSKYGFPEGYILQVLIYYSNGVPAPYTPNLCRFFLIREGQEALPLSFDDEEQVTMVRSVSDGFYIATVWHKMYTQSAGSSFSKLWFMSFDGNLTCVNDLLPDHSQVELLGTVGDSAYLRCLWQSPNLLVNGAWVEDPISLINDGFFTLSREYALTKLHPYVSVNEVVLTEEGVLYALPGWRSCILNLTSGIYTDLSHIPLAETEYQDERP